MDLVTQNRQTLSKSGWSPAANIVNPANYLLYVVAKDGDAYLSVKSPFQVNNRVLVRVSTTALRKTSKFFEAQFSDRWSQGCQYTTAKPLIINERFINFVEFLHFCHEDDIVPQAAHWQLGSIAILCDKYLFRGRLPSWCFDALYARLPNGLPLHSEQTAPIFRHGRSGHMAPVLLTQTLEAAYLLDLPAIFAKASRAIMWTLDSLEVIASLRRHDVDILPGNFVENFREEALRLRSELVSRLPAVFYPDRHGSGPFGCGKCAAKPHEERWRCEVITKDRVSYYALGLIFWSYLFAAERLARRQQEDKKNNPSLECGHFRYRTPNATKEESMWQIYQAIGGLCLNCVKAGSFRYATSCREHNVDLCYN